MYRENESSDSDVDCCIPHNKANQKDNKVFQFFRDSSIHGLKFIGQLHVLSNASRLFWTISVLSSVLVSVYLILVGVVFPLQASPVLIAFQDREIQVDEIPFPAFTICNTNKIKRSVYERAVRSLDEYQMARERGDKRVPIPIWMDAVSLDYLIKYCILSQSFSDHFSPFQFYNLQLSNITSDDKSEIVQLARSTIASAFHRCDESLLLCLWNGDVIPCSRLFHPTMTEYGFCCSFNSVPKEVLMKNFTRSFHERKHPLRNETRRKWKKWAEKGEIISEKDNPDPRERPRRQMVAGMSSGLSILVNPEEAEFLDKCRTQDSLGFRAQVHSPLDNPHVADFGKTISPNTETFISVVGKVILADKDIENMRVERRECYFQDDFKLASFNPLISGSAKIS